MHIQLPIYWVLIALLTGACQTKVTDRHNSRGKLVTVFAKPFSKSERQEIAASLKKGSIIYVSLSEKSLQLTKKTDAEEAETDAEEAAQPTINPKLVKFIVAAGLLTTTGLIVGKYVLKKAPNSDPEPREVDPDPKPIGQTIQIKIKPRSRQPRKQSNFLIRMR